MAKQISNEDPILDNVAIPASPLEEDTRDGDGNAPERRSRLEPRTYAYYFTRARTHIVARVA